MLLLWLFQFVWLSACLAFVAFVTFWHLAPVALLFLSHCLFDLLCCFLTNHSEWNKNKSNHNKNNSTNKRSRSKTINDNNDNTYTIISTITRIAKGTRRTRAKTRTRKTKKNNKSNNSKQTTNHYFVIIPSTRGNKPQSSGGFASGGEIANELWAL